MNPNRGGPLVSVVLPVRNEARWVGRALRSVQRQTLQDFEVLVIDDASVDGTAAAVARAAAADPRIRLLRNEGAGFTDALNSGLHLASAELVARLDADDVALPTRLEQQVAELRRNPRAVALGTYGLRVNEWGLPVGPLRTGPRGASGYHAAMAARQTIRLTHSSVMFRRGVALEVGGYSADHFPADDFWLWNALTAVGEVYALPRLLTLYTLRRRCISVDDTVLMVLQADRVRAERWGHPASPEPALRAAAGQLQHRRRIVRALINGHVREAAGLLRTAGSVGDLLRSASHAWKG
jgi:glycosyltransferase involved in cell wall biosynthesis